MAKQTPVTRYYGLLGVFVAVVGIVLVTARDLADRLHAPTAAAVAILAAGAVVAIAAVVVTFLQTGKQEEQAHLDREREVVGGLLTFLEERRLLTDDTGYESHFPDHLRQSAEEIRGTTNAALQNLDRDSVLVPALKKIQAAARNFQEATEGAMDGRGMTPELPMGLKPYLRSFADYREEIASGMKEAASLCDLPLAEDFLPRFEEGQQALRSIADGD